MKGNKKILVIAILLLLISVTFTTYAIYRTGMSGTGTVDAAAWTVAFKNGQTTVSNNFELTFGAGDCDRAYDGTNYHVVDGKIAPGVVCTKTITVDATGTETDVKIEAALTSGSSITATKGGSAVTIANSNDIDVDISTNAPNDIITYDASTRTATVTVQLTWDGEEGDSYDSGDTSLAGATFTVPITLTAKQYLGS